MERIGSGMETGGLWRCISSDLLNSYFGFEGPSVNSELVRAATFLLQFAAFLLRFLKAAGTLWDSD